jgi:hypothetical protein
MKQWGENYPWPVQLILVKSNKVVELNRVWNLTIVGAGSSGEMKEFGAMEEGDQI